MRFHKKPIILSFLLFFKLGAYAQVNPVTIGTFDSRIKESSALEIADSSSLWTLNDSGNPNEIYKIDHSANIIQTVTISNATNVDWEDMSKDDSTGRVFIGDCGNNANERTDLKIYITKPDSLTGANVSITAETISFHYPDQHAFPPADANLNFDCESQFYYNNNIYLISKNRSSNGTGYGKLYRLPATPGNYTAELIDSFKFDEPVTAADISPDKKYIMVTGYLNVWVFYNYSSPEKFMEGSFHKMGYLDLTQKEGLVIVDSTHIYISDEKSHGTGGKLYEMSLSWFTTGRGNLNLPQKFFFAFPNPCTGQLYIKCSAPITNECSITITDITGRSIRKIKFQNSQPIDVSDLYDGEYFLQVTDGERTETLPLEITR